MTSDEQIDLLCKNIRYLRRFHSLTQKQMATSLHISVYSLRELELGRMPPRLTIDFLIDLCRYFKLQPKTLLETNLEAGKTEKHLN